MARRRENRRITEPGTRNVHETPTLRQRSPVTYWVLMLLVASLLIGPVLLVVQMLV
ncbi:MAG: hypothetical protein AAFZ07_16740 [Actinomycetota bacterium]